MKGRTLVEKSRQTSFYGKKLKEPTTFFLSARDVFINNSQNVIDVYTNRPMYYF